jgi:hypothetical protein
MSKAKPPVMFLEYCDKRNSGFVKDGTAGTPFHEELSAPSVAWIPNKSKRAVIEKIGGVETLVYKDIRWINGCNTIDPQEQERIGVKPNPKEDLIMFEKGYATMAKEGSTLSLYDYLEVSLLNKNNPHRPPSLEPLYQVQQLDKEAEELNESEIEIADAIHLVSELRIKTGNKETPYKYDEDRINLICEVCQVMGDTPSIKLSNLMRLAKVKPRWFLDLVTKFEQTIVTEVAHALELQVIRFDANTAQYAEGDKILRALGSGHLGHEKKISLLAQYLGSSEGAQDLTELRAHIEVAKKKALK